MRSSALSSVPLVRSCLPPASRFPLSRPSSVPGGLRGTFSTPSVTDGLFGQNRYPVRDRRAFARRPSVTDGLLQKVSLPVRDRRGRKIAFSTPPFARVPFQPH